MTPFASWEPDRSDFDPNVADRVLNVMAKATSYGPFPSFVPVSEPLEEPPLGAFLARTDAGAYWTFVGTKTGLWAFDGATLDFDDLTRTSDPYEVPDEKAWAFTQFGDYVIATNGADDVQFYAFGSSTEFDDLAGTPPKGAYAATVGDFLVLGNTDVSQRQVAWSGLNDAEHWVPRKKLSDFQTFPEGGEVLGIAGYEQGAVIFQDNIIREMVRSDTFIFTFAKTDETRTIVAPRSIVAAGGQVFFLTLEGFFRYGRPSVPIGNEKVDRFFAADADSSFLWQTQGTVDPINKCVYWRYKSVNHPNPETTDRVIVYNYVLDRWSLLNVELSWMFAATTPGYTMESLDNLGIPLDDLPASLDSRFWSGGSPLIGGFDADFRLGFFSGTPLMATLQTGDAALGPRRSYVRGFRLIGDPPTFSGRVAAKDTHGSVRTWGAEHPVNRTGIVPARSSGRLHRFEVTIPADVTWAHVHGVEPDGGPEGDQ